MGLAWQREHDRAAIIQLVKSLPPTDQQAVRTALSAVADIADVNGASFRSEDFEGLPDDDPFFKVMEEIEQQRHAYPGRPAPELD